MSSQVEIVNMALTRIGQIRITSMDQQAEPARAAKAVYDMVRLAVLRDFPWNFAMKIKILAASAIDAAPPWGYTYIYPSDALMLRRLYNTYTPQGRTEDYQVIQSDAGNYRIVACNISPAIAEYTANVTDTTLFDPLFVDAFSWRLAAELAYPLSAKAAVGEKLYEKYYLALEQAKNRDANESSMTPKRVSSYIDARR